MYTDNSLFNNSGIVDSFRWLESTFTNIGTRDQE